MIGRPWRASCSCCTPGAGGGTYPRSWGAGPVTRLGGGAAGMAGGRGVGEAPPAGARRTLRGADPGLVPGQHRLGVGAGQKGGELTGPNPTDRGKPGTKYHLLTDRNGLPLHVLASAANVHDSRLFEPLLESNPGVRGRRGHPGRPRRCPEKLHADKGYDYPRCRRCLHRRGIKVRIARRGIEDKNHLGRHRWVVERTISWVLRFKRLGLRYDRTAATLLPLLLLGVTLINLRRLRQARGNETMC